MAQALVSGLVYLVFHLAAGYVWFSYWQQRRWTSLDSLLAALLLVVAQTIAGVFLLGWLGLFSTASIWLWQIIVIFIVGWFSRRTIRSAWKVLIGRQAAEYIVVGLVFLLGLLVIALSFNSRDISFDSLNYHLPWAAYLLQQGKIEYFITLIPWINVYPKAIEAWQAWHLAFWHNQSLLQTTNLLFWLLGALTVYALAREFKISQGLAFLAGLTYALVPVNLLQLRTNYIDLALSAVFLLLLYWSIKKYDESWWLWSITAGILIGSKATMIPLVILATIWKLVMGRPWPYKWPWYVLMILSFGSFFYIRNWWAHGTPLYPVGPGLISLDQLLGNSQAAVLKGHNYWEQLWINFSTVNGDYSYQMNPGGFGWLWLGVLLPALIFFLVWGWKQRQWKFYSLIIVLVLGFLIMPANWWLRYSIFVTAAGSLALTGIINCLHGQWRWLVITWTLLLIINSCLITSNMWQPTQITDRFPEFVGLEAIQQPGSVVAYDGRLQILFPLWNINLSNTVIFVSAAAIPYEKWRASLEAAKVDYLVTKYPSFELQFIQQHPQDFNLVRDNGDVKFWILK
ncbi:MAG: hypothetical protein V1846_04995 [Candidatus Komeilibacteria bacterium]